jgi:hypothetical protein
MVHHDRRSRLLGIEKERRSQPHAHILFRLEQCEQLRLILQVRARRITERIARPALLLMKEVANLRRVFPGNPQLFAHFLVMQFGERLGGLHAQPVQVEVSRILAAFE